MGVSPGGGLLPASRPQAAKLRPRAFSEQPTSGRHGGPEARGRAAIPLGRRRSGSAPSCRFPGQLATAGAATCPGSSGRPASGS